MELMVQLHRQHPTLPVIILTAHGTIPDAVAATHQGAFSFYPNRLKAKFCRSK